MKRRVYLAIGRWYWRRWHTRASNVGVFHVARQLRKQGVPVEVARAVLAVQPVPTLYDAVELELGE